MEYLNSWHLRYFRINAEGEIPQLEYFSDNPEAPIKTDRQPQLKGSIDFRDIMLVDFSLKTTSPEGKNESLLNDQKSAGMPEGEEVVFKLTLISGRRYTLANSNSKPISNPISKPIANTIANPNPNPNPNSDRRYTLACEKENAITWAAEMQRYAAASRMSHEWRERYGTKKVGRITLNDWINVAAVICKIGATLVVPVATYTHTLSNS